MASPEPSAVRLHCAIHQTLARPTHDCDRLIASPDARTHPTCDRLPSAFAHLPSRATDAAPEVSAQSGETPNGGEWSAAADVWSTGVVMYALLANSPLQWSRDGPDFFAHRVWRHVSTKAKLLLK